jgi:serine/threonine protein kinase
VELGTTILAGRYLVLAVVAESGPSILYEVEHVRTGEHLAMKVLRGRARQDPQALQRFKQEARAVSQIKSEHVVRVIDADTAPELDDGPFLVMELLRGSNLEVHATRNGPLDPTFVLRILTEVGSVVSQAHRNGIVHRDLKPENLFLHDRADGTTITKVLDFGISKFAAATEADAAVTSTGAVLGTPLYMAPEQANGENDAIGPATDIWAIGLIAIRLLAGESYWGEPTMAELIAKITVRPLVPPSKRWPDEPRMTPALDAWFLRSCARDSAKRWSSVEQQLAALADALAIASPAKSGVEAPTPRPPRARMVAVVALVALALVVPVVLQLQSKAPAAAHAEVRGESAAPPTATNPEAPSALSAEPVRTSTVAASASVSSPPPIALRPRASASVRAPSSGESAAMCASGEVLSSGHCCPAAHVWRSDRCVRPIATAF